MHFRFVIILALSSNLSFVSDHQYCSRYFLDLDSLDNLNLSLCLFHLVDLIFYHRKLCFCPSAEFFYALVAIDIPLRLMLCASLIL